MFSGDLTRNLGVAILSAAAISTFMNNVNNRPAQAGVYPVESAPVAAEITENSADINFKSISAASDYFQELLVKNGAQQAYDSCESDSELNAKSHAQFQNCLERGSYSALVHKSKQNTAAKLFNALAPEEDKLAQLKNDCDAKHPFDRAVNGNCIVDGVAQITGENFSLD